MKAAIDFAINFEKMLKGAVFDSNNKNKNSIQNEETRDWNEVNQCINALNTKLFYQNNKKNNNNSNNSNDNNNNNSNNNTTTTTTRLTSDISIETMNNLLLQIDYDIKNDDNNNNDDTSNNDNNKEESILNQLYPLKLVHFIEAPVKMI